MATHTTTGEWQIFESRMGRRRAARLALRADAAAELDPAGLALELGRLRISDHHNG